MYITIPKPCQEKWSEMLPTANGRFCAVCQKNVVDFTQKSEKEILLYFLQNPTTCGRFKQIQVNRDYTPMPESISQLSPYTTLPKWKKLLLAASLFLSLYSPLAAQNPTQTIELKGVVMDKMSKQAVPFAAAILYEYQIDSSIVDIAKYNSDESGAYVFTLAPNKRYRIVASADDYLGGDLAISTINTQAKVLQKNIFVELEPIDMGRPHFLNRIYFDESTYFLRNDAIKELGKLVELLKHNPQITLQIVAHTDTQEAGEKATYLADMRAKAIVKYFVEKGIDPERLTWVAYGSKSPIYENEKNEIERQVNRRAEFRITSFDYKK